MTSIIGVGALCTALTLPYIWFVLPPYLNAAYYRTSWRDARFHHGSTYPQQGSGIKPEDCSYMLDYYEFSIVFSWFFSARIKHNNVVKIAFL
jgi:hypothetical protein